jgi:hypothetical protein
MEGDGEERATVETEGESDVEEGLTEAA